MLVFLRTVPSTECIYHLFWVNILILRETTYQRHPIRQVLCVTCASEVRRFLVLIWNRSVLKSKFRDKLRKTKTADFLQMILTCHRFELFYFLYVKIAQARFKSSFHLEFSMFWCLQLNFSCLRPFDLFLFNWTHWWIKIEKSVHFFQ